MEQTSIIQFIARTFPGVDIVRPEAGEGLAIAAGDTFFYYDPQRDLDPRRRFPFATIVTKDYGGFDHASNVNRPGVFRLNIGVSKRTCEMWFGSGGEDGDGVDFTTLDRVLPHPVYGRMHWLCVLSPSDATFRRAIQSLLAEAHGIAMRRHPGARTESDGGA